jgi:dTDP-4-amino-4,6-dideoxygalactose transaminase
MNNKRIFLSLAHLGGDELKYIQTAFAENWVTSGGPNVDEFKKYLENYLVNDFHVGALSSGTAALYLGLILL